MDKILAKDNSFWGCWGALSINSNAISILKKHPDKINWQCLCANTNPEAIELIRDNINKLDIHCWWNLSENPNAIPILEKHLDKVDWRDVSRNPNAISILEKHLEKADWSCLSQNPNAIPLLEKHMDKIDWNLFAANANGGHILEANIDRFYSFEMDMDSSVWIRLAKNPCAIPVIEKFVHKINMRYLCKNPNALLLIEKHLYKMNDDCWNEISQNPSIFVLDTNAMKEQCRDFAEDLSAYVFHPERVEKMAMMHHMDFDKYMELI
jgi:hypothetical protein